MIHIKTANITLGTNNALATAFFQSLFHAKADPDEHAEPANHAAPAAEQPQIGTPWPGHDGAYAGIARGEDGEPDGHIILLDTKPPKDLNWADAVAWAQSLGDGARLPTRTESALLYANVRHLIETGATYWIGEQYSESHAWGQYFDDGSQLNHLKELEARARAVRRLAL